MGYDRTGFDQPTAFRIRQMNTMSEDGTVCNQSCPLVYFQVILAVGTQGKRAVDLVFILGKMRLYISARILFVQTSSRNQLFRRTGDGKTGRDDIAVPPFSMPRFDQRTTFGFPLFRRIGQSCRSIPVHQHFSGQHTHIIFRRNGEESGDGCWMYRCISHASCRSVPE